MISEQNRKYIKSTYVILLFVSSGRVWQEVVIFPHPLPSQVAFPKALEIIDYQENNRILERHNKIEFKLLSAWVVGKHYTKLDSEISKWLYKFLF